MQRPRRLLPLAALLAAALLAPVLPVPIPPAAAQSGAAQPGAAPSGQRTPPRTPFLTVETGMHNAPVARVVASRDGGVIVTISRDKTARVWAPDGRLVRTLRVPIGEGAAGQLLAAAVSPDGTLLVVGGNTGTGWDDRSNVYVFEIGTGRLLRPIRLLSDAVTALAFAPDGRSLAIGFHGTSGVWRIDITDLANLRPLGSDRQWGGAVQALAFGPGGQLAASGADGAVRLYATPDLASPRRRLVTDGRGEQRVPGDLAFSPDGRMLAVGIADRPMVRVLDAGTLEPVAAASLPLGNGLARDGNLNLRAVTWVEEGGRSSLVAAGHVLDAAGNFVALRWDALNRPPAAQGVIGRDTVTGLAALPGRRIAFGAADPAWGVLDGGLREQLSQRAGIADFRLVALGGFRVSPDGLSVEFGMERAGRARHRFDLGARQLTARPGRQRRQLPAGARGAPNRLPAGLPLANWENSSAPDLAGRPMRLPEGELTRSVDAPADASAFVLGTDTHLRGFTRDGRPMGPPEPVPATAWGVAVTPDGRTVVAALGDGTLRWYAFGAGGFRHLATLFPHRDGRRWALWTPEGFFDHADEGGQGLVGYVLNNAAQQAPDWVNFAQLYRSFYAPELVRGRLTGTGEAALRDRLAAIGDVRRLLDSRPPPEVGFAEICFRPEEGAAETCRPFGRGGGGTRGLGRVVENSGPAAAPAGRQAAVDLPAGVTSVRVVASLRDRGGGIGNVDVFVNERSVGREAVTRGLGRVSAGGGGERPLPEPGGAVKDPPAAGAAPPGASPAAADGSRRFEHRIRLDSGTNLIRLRAFDGGNETFAHSEGVELRTVAPARSIRPTLHVLSVGVDAYAPDWVRPLRFAVADARAVAEAVRQRAGPLFGAVKVVLLPDGRATRQGIGEAFAELARTVRPEDTVLLYLAGHGLQTEAGGYVFLPSLPATAARADVEAEGVTDEQLLDWWRQIPAQHSMMLLDTCHAGALSLNFAGRMANESGRYVLAAATAVEEALDSFDGRNGLFAVTVLEALRGESRRRVMPDAVDNFGLGWHVRDRVPVLARQRGFLQSAEFRGQGGELIPFPIVPAQVAR